MENHWLPPLLLLLCVSTAGSTVLQDFSSLPFEEGYTRLFGDQNLVVQRDGKTVHVSLDKTTGSGFVSSDLYQYGFFSASIKLPGDYTAGVVVAFYMSNGDMFEDNHDEIDFEFLGNIRGREWRMQTNVYGNGSTSRGREERYGLWFDPSEDFHRYSMLWTTTHIVFYVDDVPIREVKRSASMGGDYPTKPMSVYTTIWDGSDWATSGGRYKVNYKLSPYVARFTDLVLHGCAVDPIQLPKPSACEPDPDISGLIISAKQRSAMDAFREKHMTYSYCYDRVRYPSPLPECVVEPEVAGRLNEAGTTKFGRRHRHHGRRQRQHPVDAGDGQSH
ncbi:putative xyloglucan endotransglucosylase/hydrolase protein 28 [Nymphaea thermarum]|nr:putative xyloglucan endotransglucosylase/hydrolase protein 28 [Nymphaea thermarum]